MCRSWRSPKGPPLVWPYSLALLPAGLPTLPKGSQRVFLQTPLLPPRRLTRSSAPGSCSTKHQWMLQKGRAAQRAQRGPKESVHQILFGQDRRAAAMVRWVVW